jgi:hypothetical protein
MTPQGEYKGSFMCHTFLGFLPFMLLPLAGFNLFHLTVININYEYDSSFWVLCMLVVNYDLDGDFDNLLS